MSTSNSAGWYLTTREPADMLAAVSGLGSMTRYVCRKCQPYIPHAISACRRSGIARGSHIICSGCTLTVAQLDEIRTETQTVTEEDSDESATEESPASATTQEQSSTAHQSFIMGYRSADVDLRPFHPLPSQIPFIWQIYQENVDPLVKILHVPSMDKLIREIRNNLDTLTPPTEALMFSIYYAAITSMDEAEVCPTIPVARASDRMLNNLPA